jgi:hypothetical protein
MRRNWWYNRALGPIAAMDEISRLVHERDHANLEDSAREHYWWFCRKCGSGGVREFPVPDSSQGFGAAAEPGPFGLCSFCRDRLALENEENKSCATG